MDKRMAWQTRPQATPSMASAGGRLGQKMTSEGAAQELKGHAQKATGDAKTAAKDAIDKTAAALKKPL